MSQLIFDPHNNDDIEDALQIIYAGDKNAISDFIKKTQGLVSFQNGISQFPNQPSITYPSEPNDISPYFTLVNENTKLKGEINNYKEKFNNSEQKYKELEEQKNQVKANYETQKNKIDSLMAEKEELNKKLDQQKEEYATLEKMANDNEAQKNEVIEKLKSEITKVENKYKQKELELNKKYAEDIKQLQDNIKVLRKNLEKYEVPADVTGETKYFSVENDKLAHTLADNAPYVGDVLANHKISYQFNTDKGKVQDSIQKRETILEPFCEIVSAVEGGNAIQLAARGILVENGGIYEVEKKAKIKIVYQ